MAAEDNWPNSKADYQLGAAIGVGATAAVYEAVCLTRNERCAIKCISIDKAGYHMEELRMEIVTMSQCQHPNVVSYYTSFVVGDQLWVVMRLLDSGSMLNVLRRKKTALGEEQAKYGVLDEATIATILKETLKGLEYFHSNGQIHRDIKAGNVLFSSDGTVQIADFGVSSFLAVSRGDRCRQKVRTTFVGTPCWMAPEVMEQTAGYDYKADIWSLGILAIELATGQAPYFKFSPLKVVIMTLENEPPTLDTNAEDKHQYKAYGKSFRTFINDCLQKDPTKRPTASELLKYSFLKKAKDKKYLIQSLIHGLAAVPRISPEITQKPTSGRLRKDSAGNWEFDYEKGPEEEEQDDSS